MEAQRNQKNRQTSWIAEPKGHYQEVNISIQPCPQIQPTKPKAQREKHQAAAIPRLVPILKPPDSAVISAPRLLKKWSRKWTRDVNKVVLRRAFCFRII